MGLKNSTNSNDSLSYSQTSPRGVIGVRLGQFEPILIGIIEDDNFTIIRVCIRERMHHYR